MNEVLHANIFFVIASIATVAFCILICVILYHVLKIVRSLRSIVERIEAGSELLAQDIAHIREVVASGGMFTRLIQFIMGAARRRERTKRKQRSSD